MTIFSQVREVRASIHNPAVPITRSDILEYIGADTSTASGVSVSETSALGLSAVWRAVNLIAGTCASLPLHAYRDGDEGRERLQSGAAADLLGSPHPDMSSFELWETVYAHVLLWGNAYLRVLKAGLGYPAELWPIHPSRVKVGRTSDIGTKVYAVDGGKEVHTDATILHIPGFGYNGLVGLSPIQAARQGLGLAMAAESYGAKLFGSGSLATGVLQTEASLTAEQADALHKRWKEKRSGLSSAHETIILDSGAKFHQLTIPPESAQFLQSRSFQVSEIARLFGVPPHMLMDTDKSTSWGTGIEQQSIGYVVYTLRPWLTRVEQRLTRVLRPQRVYARYSVEGLLRGDSAQRADFYNRMWNLGVFSTNEIRELEERGPVENGDVRYRPLNMGVLGEADPTPELAPTTQEAPADA